MFTPFPFSFFFLLNLFTASLLTLSSYSWLAAWAGLEFNLISFLPLLMTNPTPSSTESAIKYFIIQAFSSGLLLLGASMYMSSPLFSGSMWLILISLSIKLGLAPFHLWVPNVTASLSWSNLFLLLTWQKVAPLFLLLKSLSPYSSKTMIIMAALSALTGGLGGMNQTQLRLLLAFSSIGHMGWMITVMQLSSQALLLYMMIYMMLLLPIISLSYYLNSKSLNSAFNLLLLTPNYSLLFILLFLSLGGMPPLWGFLPKLMVIKSLMSAQVFFVLPPLILGSLMNLYYYISFSSVILMSKQKAFKQPYTINPFFMLTALPSIFFFFPSMYLI